MKKDHIGMKPFKISIDLVMPQSPTHEVDDLISSAEDVAEDGKCDVCGEIHSDEVECGDNKYNMRNGPIPELVNDDPVVDSSYLKKIKKAFGKIRGKAPKDEEKS